MSLSILHVVFSLEPGGMENGLVNVAKRLSPDEFKVDICCLERRGEFADRLPDSSEVIVLNKPPGKSIYTVWKLIKTIRRIRPDIVHTHDLGPLIYGVWGTLGGRLSRIVHGEHCQFSDFEMTSRRLRQRRKYYRCCARLHTVSSTLANQIESLEISDHKPTPLINGVDSHRFSMGDPVAARDELGIPHDACVIGLVGRMVPHKRHLAVIDAFEALDAVDSSCLLLVGDGECMPKIRERREASPFKRNIFIEGFMPNPECAYRAMDVLVLPSLLEGLSNALLEAMACGVPCLAHSSCGCAEVIQHGNNGLIYDLSTDEALKRALNQVVGDDLKVLGSNARKTAVDSFSMESMVRGYSNMYREVMGRDR